MLDAENALVRRAENYTVGMETDENFYALKKGTAPLISGKEPAFQRLGVNILFVALLILVVGSLGFGWLGAMGCRNGV